MFQQDQHAEAPSLDQGFVKHVSVPSMDDLTVTTESVPGTRWILKEAIETY